MKSFTIANIGLSPPFTDLPNSTFLNEAMSKANYTALSNLQHNYYEFYLGTDPMDQVNLEEFNTVYDNGNFSLIMPNNALGS